MCCTLSVVKTSIPASSSSSTSCQRFGVARAGRVRVRELVDEDEPRLARERAVEIELARASIPRCSHLRRGSISRPMTSAPGVVAPVRLDDADDDVALRDPARVRAASSIAYVLPTPGAAPKKMTSLPRFARRLFLLRTRARNSSGSRRGVAHGGIRRATLASSSARFNASTFTRGSPRMPELPALRVLRRRARAPRSSSSAARLRDAVHLV